MLDHDLVIKFIAFLGFLYFIAPFIIVSIWRKRPRKTLVIALLVALLPAAIGLVTGLIKTFQAIAIYGSGDPQLVAGGIAESIVYFVLAGFFWVPILFLYQWLTRKFIFKL